MPLAIIAVAAALAAVLCLILLPSLRRGRRAPAPGSESMLLEEAVVTEPVAPGLEGAAELRSADSPPRRIKVRATDAFQAFARGEAVRIVDVREGVCIVEGADQEHRAR